MNALPKISFYLIRLTRVIFLFPLKILALVWIRDRKRVVIGAWFGDLYADNQKYLAEYILKHSDKQVTWIANKHVQDLLPNHPRMHFAAKGSLKAFWNLLNADTWICSQTIEADLTSLPIRGTALMINPFHGIPVKYVGGKVAFNKNQGKGIKYFLGLAYTFLFSGGPAWLTISSEKMGEILCSGMYPYLSMKRLLRFGTPRNDFLIGNQANLGLKSRLKHKYGDLLGFDPEKKVILYLPTWRARGDYVFSFYNLPPPEQDRILRIMDSHNAVIVEKHHFQTYKIYPATGTASCSKVITAEMQTYVDTQELLLITDILLCDYSSAYIDFALQKKPVVHFAYDLSEYVKNDSGLAYNLSDVAAGPIVSTLEDTLSELEQTLANPVFRPAPKFKELIPYEKGNSSENILRFIDTRKSP